MTITSRAFYCLVPHFFWHILYGEYWHWLEIIVDVLRF